MPSRLNNGAASSRFELPALDLNFGSITDGTDIPPPPDSPVQKVPTPPKTPPPPSKRDDANSKHAGSMGKSSTTTNGNLAGIKQPADDAPLSPAGSSRQGSLRRLLSRTMLNNTSAEGQLPASASGPLANGSRPESQSGGSVIDERKSKRASGWFRRLRSGDQQQSKRRSSLFGFEEPPAPVVVPKKSSGPPPPMIPELSHLGRDKGSLGRDLFKHIK